VRLRDLTKEALTRIGARCSPSHIHGLNSVLDEFCDRMHELKAFDEFLNETGMKFRALGATKTLEHVAFERTS